MIVKSLNRVDGKLISNENLLFYLSQVVLTKTDEEIERAQSKLEEAKEESKSYRAKIIDIKTELTDLTKEFSKEKALKRVLSLINTLNREGVLIGKSRINIVNMLQGIDNKDFESLRNIEERLSLKIPDKF